MLKFYRWLPYFKGKLRLGNLLFKNRINKNSPVEFTAHQNILYKIPNTLENLGVVLMITGVYEKKVINFLGKQVKNGHVYFDIGANIGAIGLPIVKNNHGVRYFGFEASPMVFKYLEHNFSKNHLNNYELHNFLVHEDNGHSKKFYQSEYYGKSSLAPTYADEHILVTSISLDLFCKQNKIAKINWIKIDVQGFELFVLKGMHQLLYDKQVKNIVFEFEYWAEEAAGLEKGAAQKYISALGYELFDLEGRRMNQIMTEGRTMIWAKPAKTGQGLG